MGGIRSARDAAEFLLAGAWAVAVGTANFFNPHATVEVAQGLGEFLASKGMRSPADLRGRMIVEEPVEELAARGG
jgi:dihydroorotate dehydrogenase (NAD+) catalytic subunit